MSSMKDHLIDSLNTNELPTYPPFGITTTQFAEAQERFTNFARGRILLGEKYDKLTHQRIETLTAEQIVAELREEIADAVNYLAGLDIYLSRIPWGMVDCD